MALFAVFLLATASSAWGAILGQLQAYTCNASSPYQQFFVDAESVSIRSSQRPRLCLNVAAVGSAWSTVALAPCNGEVSQRVVLTDTFQIKVDTRDGCLLASECSLPNCCTCLIEYQTETSTQVMATVCDKPPAYVNQEFHFDNATGLIKSAQSGLCLDTGTLPPLPLLASHFGDNMVLQRGGAGPTVWGFVAPGAAVNVTFARTRYATTGDEDGVWRVRLAPREAGGSYSLTVTSGEELVHISNILIGDVYLVGGQSNAVMSVAACFNASAEMSAAAFYQNIRVMTVGQGTTGYGVPLKNLGSVSQPWEVASPPSIGRGEWTGFSAIGWFFGRDVYNGLNGTVPIGLISDNWGGTPIEYWMSPAALLKCTPPPRIRSRDFAPDSSSMYNSMIAPLTLGPLALTGVLWYQGEHNVGPLTPSSYECALQALVTDWRSDSGFNNSALWFGSVQLAPWIAPPDTPIPVIRAAQEAVLALDNTALITAIDQGDGFSPEGSIHPRRKQAVGARLAANALAQVYGQAVPHVSPRLLNATGSLNGDVATVTVYFVPDSVVDGVTVVPTPLCPEGQGVQQSMCGGLEVQLGEDWVPANATEVSGNTIVATAQAPFPGAGPSAVRYAYSVWPLVTLYSGAGFPVLPFNAPVTPV